MTTDSAACAVLLRLVGNTNALSIHLVLESILTLALDFHSSTHLVFLIQKSNKVERCHCLLLVAIAFPQLAATPELAQSDVGEPDHAGSTPFSLTVL